MLVELGIGVLLLRKVDPLMGEPVVSKHPPFSSGCKKSLKRTVTVPLRIVIKGGLSPWKGLHLYTGCQKRLRKCRACKRRVQGVRREWMNILDRGITQEPGFPRRNLNSHARAAARVSFPPTISFPQVLLAISI